MNNKMKSKFNEWFFGVENFSLRYERFIDDLQDYQGDNPEVVEKWLKAAFEVGYDAGVKNRGM